jgi:surface antigen
MKQEENLSKVQTALAVTAVGTMGAFAIGALIIFPSPVEANVAIATNTGVSCSDCHSDPANPATSALTGRGAAYRDCLYNSAPGQPNCNIQIQSWQRPGAGATPQSVPLPSSAFGSPQPNNNMSLFQSNSNSNLANGLGGSPGSVLSQSPVQPLQEPNGAGNPEGPAVQALEDRAYVPPAQTEPPLPQLPSAPVLLQGDYPDCREDHLFIPDPLDKAKNINECTTRLDGYYSGVLTEYRKRMNEYQDELSRIYTEKVAGRMEYSAASRDQFYKDMMQEHANSDPEGTNMAVYRAAEQLYQADRNYLSDRYCYNTGCGGYPVPENYGFTYVEESSSKPDKPGKLKKSAGKAGGDKSCKKSRGRGQLLGGIFGSVIGSVAGLDDVGVLLAGAVGAVLVGEIACKLSQDEQEKAAEATLAVVEKEEVGAVANWQSPTRGGVSGSSTVTALNTEPNGRKCLTITDVAIIDGEETRVSKQMCRGSGDSKYAIKA